MKKMKRVLVALLSCLTAFACLAGTVACGKDKAKDSASTPNTSVSESVADSSSEEVADSSVEEESSEEVVDSSSEEESSEVVDSSVEEDSSSEEVETPHDCAVDGHMYVPVEAIEPTCTKNGRAATIGCSECDWIHDPAPVLLDRVDYATESDYEDALYEWGSYWSLWGAYGAHEWSEEATEKVEPTCCAEGVKAYYTCANCDALSLNGYSEMDEDATIVIPATGNHKYVSYVVPVAATCTEDGCTVGWECEEGGYVVSEVIPAFGHSYVFDTEAEDYAGSKAPDCVNNAVCFCGVELEETALGHSLVNVEAQVVTCAADGWNAFEYCENCEYTTFEGKIKAANHWAEQKKLGEDVGYTKVAAVAAKCGVEGNKAYYVCNDCSAVRSTLTGSVLTEEQIKTSIVIKALEHSFTKADKVAAKAATCDKDGNTAGGTCSKCGEFVASEVIPALGHTYVFDVESEDYVANTVLPTCKTDAKCGRCKVVLEDTKLGHTWEYVGVVYAECEKAGVAAHYECDTCGLWAVENNEEDEKTADKLVDGYTETAASKFVIKALGHDIVNVPAKAPTCYAIGWNAYKYCAHCSYTTYKELDITVDHESKNMVSCSLWLVCETFATADNNKDEVIDENDIYDVNEDGEVNELDNIHIGCGKVYKNPAPIAHTWNEDNICSICSECNHLWNSDGVCKNCGKCDHWFYDDGECVYCGEPCNHASFTGIYCDNCDYVCEHEAHNVEGKCVLCGSDVAHDIDPETGKCVCGLMCEHNFVTVGEDKVCSECGYVCLHVDYTDGVCVCGKVCAHAAHDTDGICLVCAKNVGHNWHAVEGETDWACDCGISCSHEMHVQASGSVFDSTCTTCGANVKHVYDLSAVTVAMPTVKCTICKGVVAVVDVCPHTGAHEQDNSCGVCGMADVAVHGDADFDGFCDICDKQGVGALITESTVLNQNIAATEVNNVAQNSQWAARVDGEDVEVTIAGGTYNAGSNKDYNIAVWAANGATVTIEDGVFTTGKDKNGDINHAVYASGGATVVINGGTFKASDDMDASMLLNCQDGNGTIIITGGTFYNFNPANNVAEGPNTNFVAEGYTVKVTTVGADTIYTVEAANN